MATEAGLSLGLTIPSSAESGSGLLSPRSLISAGTNAKAPLPGTRLFSRTPLSWDPQDDILLRHLKEQQKLGWKEIALHFAHRTPNACQFRWRRLKSGALKHLVLPTGLTNTSAATIAASFSEAKFATNLKSRNVNSALAGLSALSSGLRDEKKKHTRPRSQTAGLGPPPHEVAPPNYTKWSFTANPAGLSTGYNSPEALSNSILLLLSFESAASLSLLPNFMKTSFVSEPWTAQEDDLLSLKKGKELLLTELSILMPWRTEEEILSRMKELDQLKKQQLHNIALGLARSAMYFDSHPNDQPVCRESRMGSVSQASGLTRTLSVSSETSTTLSTFSFKRSDSRKEVKPQAPTASPVANNLSILDVTESADTEQAVV